MTGKRTETCLAGCFKRLWLVAFLLLLSFSGSACSVATCEEPFWKDRFRDELQRIIDKHPKYVWGGAESIEKGLDCSGYIYLAGKWAGIPGITRTTALAMAEGRGGWLGADIEWHESVPLNLVWWTLKPNRPHGHVGVLWPDEDGYHMVTHASMGRMRIVVDRLENKLWDDISKIRRLGD